MFHTLVFPLVGPMQAWGSRSSYDDRDTHPEPTKSGVIGLICAALGRDRSEDISDLAALRFGVRVDAPGRAMVDYQTAQHVLMARGTGETNVNSWRHYLADARFLVGFEAPDAAGLALLVNIEEALQNPHWVLSLGRKAYPPSLPPYIPGGGIRQGMILEEALAAEPWRILQRREKIPSLLRIVVENSLGDTVQSDVPRSFQDRTYGLRRILRDTVPPKLDEKGEATPWVPLS